MLHIATDPLFNPKPINPCAATAVNTETVRIFFLPTRYKLWEAISELTKREVGEWR